MLSFALESWLHGLNPRFSRLLNLAIHLSTGLLFFLSARLWGAHFAQRGRLPAGAASRVGLLAALAAAIWVLHPFNLTSVAYVIQRMNALAALFTLAAVLWYTWERHRQQVRPGRWIALVSGLAGFGILGVLSKENAALLPVFLLVIELFVFQGRAQRKLDRRLVIAFFVVSVGIPAFLVGYWLMHSEQIWSYAVPYTAVERLLTQARILWEYLGQILAPDIGRMSLFHDGYRYSTGLLEPPVTLLAVLAWGVSIGLILWLRRSMPWLALGLFWFLGGHLMESTVLPLELIYEHRNYVPAMGILFAGVLSVATVAERSGLSRRLGRAIPVVAVVALLILLASVTHLRAQRWSGELASQLAAVSSREHSPRANLIAVDLYSRLASRAPPGPERERLLGEAVGHGLRAAELAPASPSPWISLALVRARHPAGFSGNESAKITQALMHSLRTGAFEEVAINGLRQLTACAVNGCGFEPGQFPQVLEAALSNPALRGGNRSRVHRNYALYQVRAEGDIRGALAEARAAVAHEPGSADARAELVQYLILAGYRDEARRELEALRQADPWGRQAATLATLARQLEQGRTDGPSPPSDQR